MKLLLLLLLLFLIKRIKVTEHYSYVIDETGQDMTTTTYVDQGVVSVSHDELFTDAVGTCSVVAFHSENKNFLSHVDAHTQDIYLINTIKKHFNPNKIPTIYVWSGAWCEECDSKKVIEKALDELKIKSKMRFMGKVNFKNKIIIDKSGKVKKV